MTEMASQEPRLLLVMEDQDLGEALREFLSDEGYTACVASSVEDALALMTTQPFDLILSEFFRQRDLVPYHSVERLRKRAQPTPVGIMTASHLSAEEVEQRGFASLLKKPFGLDDLRTTIVACLQHRCLAALAMGSLSGTPLLPPAQRLQGGSRERPAVRHNLAWRVRPVLLGALAPPSGEWVAQCERTQWRPFLDAGDERPSRSKKEDL